MRILLLLIAAAILCIASLASFPRNTSALLPDPDSSMTIKELQANLIETPFYARMPGTRLLSHLSKEYRWILVSALESRFEDVRIAAIRGLTAIGDHESGRILFEYLSGVKEDSSMKIAVAEALSKIMYTEAIPLLNQILETADEEEVREFVARSISRIEYPGAYDPLFDGSRHYVDPCFFIEDIKSIRFLCPKFKYDLFNMRTYEFRSDEWEHLIDIVCGGNTYVPQAFELTLKALIIDLEDGRQAKLLQDKDTFHYVQDSFYREYDNYGLYFKNKELADYIERSIDSK